MGDLKSLNESLSAAARILDLAAKEIRVIPLNPIKDNISLIGEALSSIFDIQKQIYKANPDLEPEYLKRPSPYPVELNRKFGEVVIKGAQLCDLGRYQEAISLYEGFINEDPPPFFINMAKNSITKIKKDYGI